MNPEDFEVVEDEALWIEAEEILAAIDAGEIETVLLDIDEKGGTLSTTPEVMDQLLLDPDDAAEIMTQVKAFLRQLPPDEDATVD